MRQVGVDGQLDLDLGGSGLPFALEVGDRLADHAHVEVEADTGDVTGLLAAEQVARATDLGSFIATCMPAPRSVLLAIVCSRSWAVSVSGLSGG